MQTTRGHADDYITNLHLVRAEQLRSLNHTGCGTGNVVVIRPKQSRMLCRLATDECNIDGGTRLGNAPNNVCDALWHNLAAGDVVGHEQTLGTNHNDVIDNHADQVLADGVVLVDGLRDGYLGANPVG